MHTYEMESFCLKCKKSTENIDAKISSTSNGKAMILSKYAKCGSKKSRFIKHQQAKGLLSKLGIKTPLSKVPILGDVLFWMGTCLNTSCKQRIKMNEIANNFILAGDKFMPEMHLKQPGFTYRICGRFARNKEKIQKFKETGDAS